MPNNTVPWGLLERLADGSVSDQELDAVTPLLTQEPLDPPDWFIARALKIPREHPRVEGKPGLLPRLMARLVFDSGPSPQLAGVRGTGDPCRRLTYATDSFTAHLEVQDEGDGSTRLSGQLLSTAGSSRYDVELASEDGRVDGTALTNSFGYFSFERLPSSTYRLVVHAGHQEVEIGTLSL